MNGKKKFKIPGLNINGKYKSAAPFILQEKLKQIFKETDRFFTDDSTDNLHSLRISFRRFRYVMEIFQPCLDTKIFNEVYNLAKKMQDVIGEGRDLDVLEIKVKMIENEINKKIPNYFFEKLILDKNKIRRNIKTELINFMINKEINRILANK
ncbi:MAG: CHAD domain-containing protein [Bacteroidota bacterium]|jgi:CHAD domain-containing protein